MKQVQKKEFELFEAGVLPAFLLLGTTVKYRIHTLSELNP
jgi:hypothetical protein